MDYTKVGSAIEPIVGGFFYNRMQADNWPMVAIIGYALFSVWGALSAWLFIEFLVWWSSDEIGDF